MFNFDPYDPKIRFLIDLLTDSSMHFFVAYWLGAVASGLIWTILFAIGWVLESLTHWKMNMVVVYCILITATLLGFSLGVLSHLGLDQLSIWWQTPLGPPLEIIK